MPAPPGSERTLEADKAMLQDQIKAHSAQVGSTCPMPTRIGGTQLFVLYLHLQRTTCIESEWHDVLPYQSLPALCRQQATFIRTSVCNFHLKSSCGAAQLQSSKHTMHYAWAKTIPGINADICCCVFMSRFLAKVQPIQIQDPFGLTGSQTTPNIFCSCSFTIRMRSSSASSSVSEALTACRVC